VRLTAQCFGLASVFGCNDSHPGCRRGRHLAARNGTLNAEVTAKPTRESAGQDARLYGRQDARRYANLNFSQPLGGTGNLPVPLGYQPGGNATSNFSSCRSSSRQGARPSLVGKLPT
jgi:hypothetical protein